MFLTKTYTVEDCKLYATMSKIKSSWTKDTSVSGRTIYKLTPNYQTDVELTFKLKGTIPSSFMVGFGETGGSPTYWSKLVYLRYNDTLYAVADNSNNISLSNPSISTDTIFKFTTSNLHSITGYLDDVGKITRNTNSGHGLNLRIDDFGGLDIDYLKVKPL